jgi:hypothetical protein
MHVRSADLGSHRAQQRCTVRQLRSGEFSDFDRPPWRGHDGGEDAIAHGYVTLYCVLSQKLITLAAVLVCLGTEATAGAQTYPAPKARRHFVTLSYDVLYTQPLHFDNHPLEDLVGRDVASAQFERFDYRTRDDAIAIDVLEFSRRSRGAGITVFPLGMNVGAALAVRGSFEDLPIVRVDFQGAGAPEPYAFSGGRAYDLGIGVYLADRSAGWGLGSHAFVLGGFGSIRGDQREGDRYFVEGGGGLSAGPLGVELSVKFAWNHFTEPVDHQFMTVPITLRGTVTF